MIYGMSQFKSYAIEHDEFGVPQLHSGLAEDIYALKLLISYSVAAAVLSMKTNDDNTGEEEGMMGYGSLHN